MTECEFNRKRQQGWNPTSPENIPLFQHGEEPSSFSSEIVTGYFWSEKEFEEVQEIGQTLDAPGELNEYGNAGSCPAEYGEGYIYTHRDTAEVLALLDYMERGELYEVVGHAFDRENVGLTSGGALDQIERIFPVGSIASCRKVSRDEVEEMPTLYATLYERGEFDG